MGSAKGYGGAYTVHSLFNVYIAAKDLKEVVLVENPVPSNVSATKNLYVMF